MRARLKLKKKWNSYRLHRAAWAIVKLVKGNGSFLFGASLSRTLLEALLIAIVAFLLAANNIMVSEYRLVALSYLPGGLLAIGWATIRLQPLVTAKVQRWRARLVWGCLLTLGAGLILGLMLVAAYLVLSLLRYPLLNFAAPTLPDLFSQPLTNELNQTNARQIAVASLNFLISGGQFASDTSEWLVLMRRLLIYIAEPTITFVVARWLISLLAIPGRWLGRLAHRRLLWQLTISHFGVVLAAFATAIISLIIFVSPTPYRAAASGDSAARQLPAREARALANALVTDLSLSQNVSSGYLEVVLQFLANNTINNFTFNTPAFTNLPPPAQQIIRTLNRNGENNTSPSVLAVANPQGQILASSDQQRPATGMLATSNLQPLLAQAESGTTTLEQLVLIHVQPDIFIAGAYPIKNQQGQVQAIVVVVEQPEVAFTSSSRLLSILLIGSVFLVVATIFVSIFTLGAALVFGFLLSRRLVRNLETLATAADELASGNLEQRVQLEAQDEVGRVAARFNTMAQRLQESQASLAQEKKVVEQALQTKREMVANVSHELRTPVSTIRAHVDWLLQSQPDIALNNADELQHYLEIIGRETERLSLLIGDLLDLSRLEGDTHTQTMQIEPVEVNDLCQEIKQTLGLLAQRERKITLTLDLAPALPLVLADRSRLNQILVNLTRNAINYTLAGGIISLGTNQPDSAHVAVWVADTGMGIAPEDLDKIFERFYRSDASRSRHTGGAGLGLAIVKTLVEAMDGTIEVTSVVGEGSKFTVILPVTAQICLADRVINTQPVIK